MIRGSVIFQAFGATQVAILDDEGWSCAGLDDLAGILNVAHHPSQNGPAAGDPFYRAVHDAADFLKGEPHVVPIAAGPPDRVY